MNSWPEVGQTGSEEILKCTVCQTVKDGRYIVLISPTAGPRCRLVIFEHSRLLPIQTVQRVKSIVITLHSTRTDLKPFIMTLEAISK